MFHKWNMRRFADYDGLALFVRTVQAGSLAAAERSLGVPKATLSRRLSLLEAELGQKLARRTRKGLVLTEHGTRLVKRARIALSLADEAVAAIQEDGTALSGTVRLSLPPDLTTIALAPALVRFKARHPNVLIDLTLSDRRVALVEEGYDLVVRMGELGNPDLLARRITSLPRRLVASPAFLANNPAVTHPAGLRHLPAIAIRSDITEWELHHPEHGVARVRPTVGFAANRQTILVQAALAGLGIANLPVVLMSRQLADGELVDVLPGWEPPSVEVTALWHRDRITERLIRAIIEEFEALFPLSPEALSAY